MTTKSDDADFLDQIAAWLRADAECRLADQLRAIETALLCDGCCDVDRIDEQLQWYRSQWREAVEQSVRTLQIKDSRAG